MDRPVVRALRQASCKTIRVAISRCTPAGSAGALRESARRRRLVGEIDLRIPLVRRDHEAVAGRSVEQRCLGKSGITAAVGFGRRAHVEELRWAAHVASKTLPQSAREGCGPGRWWGGRRPPRAASNAAPS